MAMLRSLFLATAALASLAGAACAQTPQTEAPKPAVAPPAAAEAPLRPCYMIVMGTVTNRDAFRAYSGALPPLYARFGGEYLAIKRGPQVLEGSFGHESVLISRWPSCAAANAFWASPEYRQLVEMRKDWGAFSVILAEGLPPAPQTSSQTPPQAALPAAR
jgi:uncharacterized protein (DUF1330 family)